MQQSPKQGLKLLLLYLQRAQNLLQINETAASIKRKNILFGLELISVEGFFAVYKLTVSIYEEKLIYTRSAFIIS